MINGMYCLEGCTPARPVWDYVEMVWRCVHCGHPMQQEEEQYA